MPTRAFDPESPGARRLAAGWRESRHRWTVRLTGTDFTDGDGHHPVGTTVELPRTTARVLVDEGVADLVSTRVATARE
jgi:hypothetical protein